MTTPSPESLAEARKALFKPARDPTKPKPTDELLNEIALALDKARDDGRRDHRLGRGRVPRQPGETWDEAETRALVEAAERGARALAALADDYDRNFPGKLTGPLIRDDANALRTALANMEKTDG